MIFLLALSASVLNTEFNTIYFCHYQDFFLKDEFHYLNVPRVGTHTVNDIFDCTFACLHNPSCLSLNMAASEGADGKLWCELLSSVKNSNPKEYNSGNKSSHHLFIQVGLILRSFYMPYIPTRRGLDTIKYPRTGLGEVSKMECLYVVGTTTECRPRRSICLWEVNM